MTTEYRPVWEITKHGEKRFRVRFPYDWDVIQKCKKLGGAKYSSALKAWTFPLDLPTVNAVTKLGMECRAKFEIQPVMKEWVQTERKRVAFLVATDDLSKYDDEKLDAMLPEVRQKMPGLWKALRTRPFQLLGTEFIARQRNVLMADQPGMGKTIQTLSAIIENDVRGMILVIAPRTAANVTWPNEIRRWVGPDEVIYTINGSQKPAERGALLTEAISLRRKGIRVWCIMGPNYARAKADLTDDGLRYVYDENGDKIIRVVNEGRPELFSIKWDAIIVDESHQTLAGATGNMKKQSAQRFGLGLLRVKDDGMRIALSGTPFRGKAHYMWGQMQWIDPDRCPAYWTWIERHFGTTKGTFGIEIGDTIKDEAAFYEELRPIMVRRTKTEVVKELPEKMYGGEPLDINDPQSPIAVWLPMTPAQQRQYEKMERSALLAIKDNPDMPVNGILAEITRLKQIADGVVTINDNQIVDATADSNKIEWILEFLESRQGAGKVIIASQFTKFIYALSKVLDEKGFGHYLLTGRQNDAERAAAQAGFQSEGGHEIFVLNTKAGGVSLTLDMADDVVLCDSTTNPDDQEQVEDRAHRVSRIHNVTIWYLASLGTIDEQQMIIATEREFVNKGIIDGQRGVQFQKRLADAMRRKVFDTEAA